MSLIYADTSALVSAYFVDEEAHPAMRALLLEGPDPVVTSALTSVELSSAVFAAGRAGRLMDPTAVIDRFDDDCGDRQLVALLALDAGRTLPVATRLVRTHRVQTLDALHVAVALLELPDLDPDAVFVTGDRQQAMAAAAEGLRVQTTWLPERA
jgi:uncharacterized protein